LESSTTSSTGRLSTRVTIVDPHLLDVLGTHAVVAPPEVQRVEDRLAEVSYGLMLGAKVLSLYGLDNDLAFRHLGFINIIGWPIPSAASPVG
jgi:hypothetical protein